MIEDDRLSPTPSRVSVPEMLDDYRRRRDAFETQARELADLHREVLSATGREGAAIVADARARVARVVAEARRDLLDLSKRLEGVPEIDDQRQALQQARRDIGRLVDEAKPEIEALRRDALTLAAPAPGRQEPPRRQEPPPRREDPPPRREEPPRREPLRQEPPRRHEPPRQEPPHREAPPREAPPRGERPRVPPAGVGQTDEPPSPVSRWRPEPPMPQFERQFERPFTLQPAWPQFRSRQVWLVGVVAAAAVLAALALWWMRRPTAREQAQQPAAVRSAAPVSPAPGRDITLSPSNARSAPSAHALTVVVEARRPVWVRRTIDGQVDAGRQMGAGERSQVVADREVSIRSGDAGAVLVSVNGSRSEPLGPDGVATTRRFDAQTQQSANRPPTPAAGASPPAAGAGAPGAGATPTTGGRNSAAPPSPPPPATAPSPPPPAAPAPRGSQPGTPQPPAQAQAPPKSSASAPELTNAAQRWFDAYYRQDAGAMQAVATHDMKVTDQRTTTERLPASAEGVRRTLEGVSFQFVGETAIMTARMIEQGTVGGGAPQHVSWISMIWIREGAEWRLMDVQILSDAKLRAR